jgi:putative transposase
MEVRMIEMDALRVKVRDGGHIQNKAIHVAMGVNMEGHKEILGLWTAQNEGAKFWLQVLTNLQNRGVKDIFIACVDGLRGFPETIETVYPKTEVQLCIVHLVRASLGYVNWKQRKAVTGDLREVYQCATAFDAHLRLDTFAKKWDGVCPMVSQTRGAGTGTGLRRFSHTWRRSAK